MIYTVKSKELTLSVDSFGCCLRSVFDNVRKRELLWQKDPAVWDCSDILIFPVIDRPTFDVDEKTYRCESKHGFVRNADFTLERITENSVTLSFLWTEETFRQFPFEFKLTAEFNVCGRTFTASYKAENFSDKTMPFFFGLHPAFCAENAQAELIFEKECSPTLHLLKDKRVYSQKKTEKLRTFHLSRKVFDELQTVIFSDTENVRYSLIADGTEYAIECNSPVLAFWSRTGGNYVCVEPWWGMADSENQPAELSQRKFVNLADGAETFSWKIAISEAKSRS